MNRVDHLIDHLVTVQHAEAQKMYFVITSFRTGFCSHFRSREIDMRKRISRKRFDFLPRKFRVSYDAQAAMKGSFRHVKLKHRCAFPDAAHPASENLLCQFAPCR